MIQASSFYEAICSSYSMLATMVCQLENAMIEILQPCTQYLSKPISSCAITVQL